MKTMILMLFLSLSGVFGLEPISMALYGAGAYVSYYFYNSPQGMRLKQALDCKIGFGECCDDKWINFDVGGLKEDLKNNVFGQHIVNEIVPAALMQSPFPSKPLVMSFHGWVGGGKNYVSEFIIKRFFKLGTDSKFFHYFNSRTHFPLESKSQIYKLQLQDWIKGNVTLCPKNIFLFDEVHKMPVGVLDGITPYLDHHSKIDGVDFRKCVFIFLSNTGGNLITERYLELWRKRGKTRVQMTLNDFDGILSRGSFNEKGGLEKSDVVDHNLIDHYVPFLPLEREHVEACINAELKRNHLQPDKQIIEEIMEVIIFGPKPENLFSTSGCKRISQKTSALIQKKRMKMYDN